MTSALESEQGWNDDQHLCCLIAVSPPLPAKTNSTAIVPEPFLGAVAFPVRSEAPQSLKPEAGNKTRLFPV